MASIARRSFAMTSICLAMVSSEAAIASDGQLSSNGEIEIARCIRQAARGQTWLEKTLWGLRDQEGGWIGAEIRNSDGSHDLGPLQINSWWVAKLAEMLARPPSQVRRWLRYDPCFNAEAARWIFTSALNATGNYWKAVGIYHSPTAWRQRKYASLVASKLIRRFGAEVFGQKDDHVSR